MKLVLATLSIILAFLFSACTDSDEYLHNMGDTPNVTVSASMTRSLDSSSRMVKADTIHPDDTLIFLVEVTPAKSIRLQKYFWSLNGKEFSTEFSVRKPIPQIGHSLLTFSLIDYFGDTISDTLQLWVGNAPILDSKSFIPLSGTQGIPARESVQFAWHAYDPDSIYKLHYHFVLTDFRGDTLTDTLIHSPNFTQRNLKPLQKYNWYVQAYNELDMASDSLVTGAFFTRGIENKGGIIGQVFNANRRSSLRQDLDILVYLLDAEKNIVEKIKIPGNTKDSILFSIPEINAGQYLLSSSIPGATDFVSDTIKVELFPNEVTSAETIFFQDSTPPFIKLAEIKDADTLNFADTLYFSIIDNGGPLSEDRIQANLEDEALPSILSEDNKFSVVLPESAKSWNYRLLNISATDLSGNSAYRTFYIKPSIYWFETNNDTTVYANELLQFFFHDKNPYKFTPKTFFLKLYEDKPPMEMDLDGKKDYRFKIATGNFSIGKNHIQCGIEYTNGITQWIPRTITLIDKNRGEND